MSLRIVRTAIDRGINFMDNSWDYNRGSSEIRMGKALRDGYRDKVFLMTKIDGRSKRAAMRQLDQSVRRLRTDRIDLVEQNIGVLGMKSMANGIILKSRTVTPVECLHYALNLPTSVVITGCDSIKLLEQAVDAVRTFRPMNAAQVEALLAKTKAAASQGEFEPFKTSSIFDSTAHPDWLGEEPRRVQQLMQV